jgi:organic hydroperoxide reductase OsmC/OhrA
MADYKASVTWERSGATFTDRRFSRAHRWEFDGGLSVPASASPHVVPVPLSDPAGVDPEEAFVAALSSCHMLWFLHIAAKRGFTIDSYRDDAVGHMEKNPEGRIAITRVTLRPQIRFSGAKIPDSSEISAMHDESHHQCFIANSVHTHVTVEPAPSPA